jgi:hypothetical protein
MPKWTTNDEVTFIVNLGKSKWSGSASVAKAGRKQLLTNYKKALEHRESWGNVDKGTVIKRLNIEIAGCER